mgnify:CR=1
MQLYRRPTKPLKNSQLRLISGKIVLAKYGEVPFHRKNNSITSHAFSIKVFRTKKVLRNTLIFCSKCLYKFHSANNEKVFSPIQTPNLTHITAQLFV